MSFFPAGLREGRPLAPLTSWKIGGPAAWFAEPETVADLRECLGFAADRGIPVLALGGGSNVLVADSGYRGLVLRYRDARVDIEAGSDTRRARIGAGALLARTARSLAQFGCAGLEWAEGIPGTIGGAVAGNAGAYGGEMAERVREVETFSAADSSRTLAGADCGFGYRQSRFRGQDPTQVFIVAVTLELRRDDPGRLFARMQEIRDQRRARTPVGLSCGSVFRNPPGDSAGRLIEAAGLKGAVRGGARISPAHANYIVNGGEASAGDVRALIALAQERVLAESGILLETEVLFVGFEKPGRIAGGV